MKVLLTGSTGQLGRQLIKNKPEFIDLIMPKRNIFNLGNKKDCYELVKSIKPNWIINSGAYTNVDQAEKNKDLAFLINAKAPQWLAESLRDFGGQLLHISTDFVFDGSSNMPYSTISKRNPINIYGASKSEGELMIENTLRDTNQYLILRTSWLMGPVGKNFALTILRHLKEKEYLSIVNDQYGSPTSTKTLSIVIWKIIENYYKNQNIKLPKILHYCDAGVASWYDIAMHIKDICLKLDFINTDKYILPIPSYKYPTLAKRPKFSVLDSSFTNELLDLPYKHWRCATSDFMESLTTK